MRCKVLTRKGSDQESCGPPPPHWTDFQNSPRLNPWHQVTSLVLTINTDTALSLLSILLTSGNFTDLAIKGYHGAYYDSDLDADLLLAAADDFWSALKVYGGTLQVFKLEFQDPKPPRLDPCLSSFTSCKHLSILATSLTSFNPLASLPKLETLLVAFPGVHEKTVPYKGIRLQDLSDLFEGGQASLRKVSLNVAWREMKQIQLPTDIAQDVQNLKEVCRVNDVQLEFVNDQGGSSNFCPYY